MSSIVREIEGRLHTFFNSFYNIYRCSYEKFADVFLRAYDHDLQGLSPVDKVLVEEMTNLIYLLRAVRDDTLNELKKFVERSRASYRYIYVVDCLGFPELYALWCRAVEAGFTVVIRVFINREATTRAFKEIFSSGSMYGVADGVGGFAFRKLDTLLHHSEIFRERCRSEFLDAIVGRMEYIVASIPLAKSNTMIFSDHGYDITRRDTKYTADHTRIPRMKLGLAKLAPVMLLKRIH